MEDEEEMKGKYITKEVEHLKARHNKVHPMNEEDNECEEEEKLVLNEEYMSSIIDG